MLSLMMGVYSFSQAAEAPAKGQAADKSSAKYSFCQSMSEHLKLFDAKRDHAENPWIQEFKLKVRGQYQWADLQPAGGTDKLKADAGGRHKRSNNEWRRFRLGAEAKVLRHFRLLGNFNLGGLDARYKVEDGRWTRTRTEGSVDEIFLQGTFEPVVFTVGKHKPAFIGEYRTSSSKILTLERSALVNQLTAEKLYGVSMGSSNKKARFGWEAGVWMNGQDGDSLWLAPSFHFDDNCMLGIGLNAATGKSGRLYFDYMHSFANTDAADHTEGSYEYAGCGTQDVFALTWEAKKGKFALMTEAMAGLNVLNGQEGAQNVFGLTVMPSYRISPHFEGVFRYQLASGSNAVVWDKRYVATNSSSASVSDLLHGVYFGVNYYVCPKDPHAMKVMAGAEYFNSHGADASGKKGYSGWQYSVAFRFNF